MWCTPCVFFKPFYCGVRWTADSFELSQNGLRYMLNFNMPFVFYQPPANVCSAEIREQSYHVINFDMVGFSECGRRAWHVGGFGSLVNCVVCDFSV